MGRPVTQEPSSLERQHRRILPGPSLHSSRRFGQEASGIGWYLIRQRTPERTYHDAWVGLLGLARTVEELIVVGRTGRTPCVSDRPGTAQSARVRDRPSEP